MSFIHYTIVGHFDAETLSPKNIVPERPISRSVVTELLAGYSRDVAELVEYRDGYVQCCWAGGFSGALGKLVHEFAYKLAEHENCIGAELPFCIIGYPPDAIVIQQRLQAEYQRSRDGRTT